MKTNFKNLKQRAKRKQLRLKRVYGVDIELNYSSHNHLTKFVKRENYRYMKNNKGDVFKREDVNIVKREIKQANERLRREEKAMTGRYRNHNKSVLGYSKFSLYEPKKLNLNRVGKDGLKGLIDYFKEIGDYKNLEEVYKQYQRNYLSALQTTFNGEETEIYNVIKKMSAREFTKLYYQDDEGYLDIGFLYDLFAQVYQLTLLEEFLRKKGYNI